MSGPFFFKAFEKDKLPDWPCPSCKGHTLQLQGKISEAHTAEALEIHSSSYGYSPDEDERVFSCMLICRKGECRQPVAVSGKMYNQQNWLDEPGGEWDWFKWYKPLYFYPALSLFSVNENYPEQIREQLDQIASLLPGHPLAAANAIRTTLELALDSLKIPRVVSGSKGKVRRLSADERIKNLPPVYADMERGFLALKWLGNTGSHGLNSVSDTDLESACKILDDFLQRMFRMETDHSAAIDNLFLNHDPKLRKI